MKQSDDDLKGFMVGGLAVCVIGYFAQGTVFWYPFAICAIGLVWYGVTNDDRKADRRLKEERRREEKVRSKENE